MPITAEKRALYGQDWAATSLRIRQDRAQWRCEFIETDTGERCRAEQGKPHPYTESKVILTVAHLDHDIGNTADDNLRAACQRCHLRWDAKFHAANAARSRRDAMKTTELFRET